MKINIYFLFARVRQLDQFCATPKVLALCLAATWQRFRALVENPLCCNGCYQGFLRCSLVLSITILLLASTVIAAELDPRLAQIQNEKQQVLERFNRARKVLNAIDQLEAAEADFRRLTQEESDLKAKTENEKAKAETK